MSPAVRNSRSGKSQTTAWPNSSDRSCPSTAKAGKYVSDFSYRSARPAETPTTCGNGPDGSTRRSPKQRTTVRWPTAGPATHIRRPCAHGAGSRCFQYRTHQTPADRSGNRGRSPSDRRRRSPRSTASAPADAVGRHTASSC